MRFERYVRALQRKGPRQLFRERYDRYVRHRLLRRFVFPTLSRGSIVRLAVENAVRRSTLRPRAPASVQVVICVDAEGPSALETNLSWKMVEAAVDRVMAPEQRSAWADPQGNPPAIGWYVVDWIGNADNQRSMPVGFHAVFDRYRPWVEAANSRGLRDEIHWHYHHTNADRLDSYNRDWRNNPVYETILSRRLLERGSWPVVYRAGNTWEDAVCSRWLERWFPFDLSSRGPYRNVHYDWRHAPTKWVLYHPSPEDVQRPGNQQRLMARCLDIEKGQFLAPEVEQAFLDAASGRPSYVSFYLHDSRDMASYISRGLELVRSVASAYPDVRWEHSSALDLFRNLSGRAVGRPPGVEPELRNGLLTIGIGESIFGEPWVGAQYGELFTRIDTTSVGRSRWTAKLDGTPDALAIAVTDPSGQASVHRMI